MRNQEMGKRKLTLDVTSKTGPSNERRLLDDAKKMVKRLVDDSSYEKRVFALTNLIATIESLDKNYVAIPCPLCGAKMKLRKPKQNQEWEAFFGCSRFPDCQGRLVF